MLFVAAILITSTFPTNAGEGMSSPYKTIVFVENDSFQFGDEVTLEIRFYHKDTLTDPDDINISHQYAEGVYIEVDLVGDRVEEGVYRVTFTLLEEHDPWGSNYISLWVACTIAVGREDVTDTVGIDLIVSGGPNNRVRVVADKPFFSAGETVRFRVYGYNNSIETEIEQIEFAELTINGVKTEITDKMQKDGDGWYYDHNDTSDTVSKNVNFLARAIFYGRDYSDSTSSYRDHYQIWFHEEELTRGERHLQGKIGVCEMTGPGVVADVTIQYKYDDESWMEITKYFNGTTNGKGVLDIELNLTDWNQYSNLKLDIWANGTGSRGVAYQQWTYFEKWQFNPQEPMLTGFTVLPEFRGFSIPKGAERSLDYKAYLDAAPLPNTNIYYYFYSSPWGSLPPEVPMGEVYYTGNTVTDENGLFTIDIIAPDYATLMHTSFKAEITESRDDVEWHLWETTLSVHPWPEIEGADVAVSNFGLGQEATITITKSGLDGGFASVGMYPLGEDFNEDDVFDLAVTIPPEWIHLNARQDVGIAFEGDQFSTTLGVPEFFPQDTDYLISIGFDPKAFNREQNPYADIYIMTLLVVIVVNALFLISYPLGGVSPTLGVSSNAPSTVNSEEEVQVSVKITGSPGVPDADVDIEVTGPATVDKSSGKTDENGDITFKLTVGNVTKENSEIKLYVNASKNGYDAGKYVKTITVKAYIEPVITVTEPEEVDLGDSKKGTVFSGVEGELDVTTTVATQPDTEDPKAIGLYLNVTKTGTGKLHWMNITIDYGDLPPGIDPVKLRIFYWDEATSEWKRAENSGVDTVNKRVWANVTHLTVFAPREAEGDITPPSIDHTRITEATAGKDLIITAEITDDGDGVETAVLNYRQKGNSQYKEIEMTLTGGKYEAVIPGKDVSLLGLEYYIMTTDGNNSAYTPTNINDPYDIYVSAEKVDDDDDDGSKIGFWLLIIVLIILFGGLLTIDKWSPMLHDQFDKGQSSDPQKSFSGDTPTDSTSDVSTEYSDEPKSIAEKTGLEGEETVSGEQPTEDVDGNDDENDSTTDEIGETNSEDVQKGEEK